MKPLWAITRLTFRNALRSHVFQLLLLLLIACVVVIPTTVSGGAVAGDFIRVSLLYSLWTVGAVLGLSSIWLGCYAMAHDIDNYQLHMVVSKPVARWTIWLGKWFGVNLVNMLLLLIATLAIYAIVMYRFNNEEFSAGDKERIRNEVLVGRRVFMPDQPDFEQEVRERVKEKVRRLQEQGKGVDMTPENQDRLIESAKAEVGANASEVPFQRVRGWVFSDLPRKIDRPLYLRYRPYVGKVSSEDQRNTRIWWQVGMPQVVENETPGSIFEQKNSGYQLFMVPLTQYPEQLWSGVFHEKEFTPDMKIITPDNKIFVSLVNFDDSQSTLYFQPADGPKLMIAVTGFFQNYFRAVLVIALQLLILSGFGCAFGGFLTMPTAIFVVISYLLFGSFSVFLVSHTVNSNTVERLGQGLAEFVLRIVIPLQRFEVTDLVAGGELIEWSLIGKLFWSYFILRAVPVFLFGIYFYRRRELGLVIRK